MTGEVMGGLLCSPTRINSYSGRTTVLLHLSAYCGGDRAIVGIALLTIIMLAWLYVGRLATSVETVGINMTGTRMVSTGTRMVTISILQPWSAAEFVFMFLIHDGRNDAAVSHPRWFCAMHGLAVRLPSIPTPSARPGGLQPVSCPYGSHLRCRHQRTMGARTRRVAYTDGEHEQFCWRYPFDRPPKSIKLRAVDGGNKSTRKCYWAYWNSGLSLKAFFVAPGRTNLLSTNLN
jgi:hypothetical protein